MGRRVARKEEKRQNRRLKLKISGAVLLVLCIAYIICCAVVPKDTVLQGVSMNGVDLGGISQQEASTRLATAFRKDYANAKLTVKALDKDYTIPMYSSLSFNDAGAAANAFNYGHRNFLLGGFQWLKALAFGQNMTYYPEVRNQAALDKELETSGLSTLDTTVQTTYELKDDKLEFVMGKTGYSVNIKDLVTEIGKAVKADDYKTVIEAPLVQGAVDALDINVIYDEIHKVKKEATLKVTDKKKYKIVKSVTGIDFDKDGAKTALEAAAEGDVVDIDIVKDKPAINTTDLKKHLFEEAVGKCTTYVSGTYARISNVRLAAKTINGLILLPGEEFSYNEAVGERTSDRGYQKAPAYSDGKTVQELGGGVCQVSSTLYKAVVLANLEVTEHHNHTYESAYIGLGMDATVSWDGPDFRFRNNTTYPVKIVAEYDGGALTCRIRGAKLDDYEVQFVADILKTNPYSVKYEKDSSMKAGKTKVIESGHNGYVVQTYRIIVDSKGNQISKQKEDKCTYSRKDARVAKGTKKAPAATTKKKEETGKTTEKPAQDTNKTKKP